MTAVKGNRKKNTICSLLMHTRHRLLVGAMAVNVVEFIEVSLIPRDDPAE